MRKTAVARICATAVSLSVFFLQIDDRLAVAVDALTLDGLLAVHSGVGDLPECLPGIHIGDVNLHGWDGNCLQRIQNGYGSVGIGGWIDDDPVIRSIGGLDGIHDRALMIGLEVIDLNARFQAGFFNQRQQIGI